MRVPYIAVGIDPEGAVVVEHVKGGSRTPFEVKLSMHELDEHGFDGASRRLGDLMFRLLGLWYPDDFKPHPHLTPPPDPEPETFNDNVALARALVAQSYAEKTQAYIPAIDKLMAPLGDNVVTLVPNSLDKVWPTIKDELLKFSTWSAV